MNTPHELAAVVSVRGHRIRLTRRQWLHISENHDYMVDNRALVLETIADPDELIVGEAGETLALRAYAQTNRTAKTAVVVYRDVADGFYHYGVVDLPTRASPGQRSACMDTTTIDRRLIPLLLQLPSQHIRVEYDAEGDVLSLSFATPQQATDSVMGEDGHVYHYRDDQLVGVTILHASRRAQEARE